MVSTPAAHSLKTEFTLAHAGETMARERTRQDAFDKTMDENKLADDVLTREQISRPVSNARLEQSSQSERSKKRKEAQSRYVMTLLDQMHDRLDTLEASMAKQLQKLRGKYGEDVIGGMAETFLNEKELSGLKTDDQKLRALTNKFLDKDGKIKDEYKHLEEAQYIRDWNEAEKLKPVVEKYNGRDTLTHEEELEVHQVAVEASLADNKNSIMQSDNDQFEQTVDTALDDSRNALGAAKTNNSFSFG